MIGFSWIGTAEWLLDCGAVVKGDLMQVSVIKY